MVFRLKQNSNGLKKQTVLSMNSFPLKSSEDGKNSKRQGLNKYVPIPLFPDTITSAITIRQFLVIYLFSLTAFWSISTEGTFMSFPDSSINILHENPAVPNGCNSFPLMNTEGEPESPSDDASSSLILWKLTSALIPSLSSAVEMLIFRASSDWQPWDK